ncbi:hypothetical protein [Candidatus Blastococcus massiliensis]|uniref:phage terminase small subunit n=1 Tax=Candidatus Blastococcus massiliensis TaxID=1470358 RepID=UPI0004B74D50|nr:hypothetical protein [Candidatus Blastococcus massiliensis]
MAGRGFPPKDPRLLSRPRDSRRRGEVQEVAAPPARQPTLPRDIDWHPRTRAWWRDWKRWPLADSFTAGDWSFLLDTALMHHRMWAKGEMKWASEIRLRVAKYGATPEDRQRLRVQFTDPAAQDPPNQRGARGRARTPSHLAAVPDDPATRPPDPRLVLYATQQPAERPPHTEGDPPA